VRFDSTFLYAMQRTDRLIPKSVEIVALRDQLDAAESHVRQLEEHTNGTAAVCSA